MRHLKLFEGKLYTLVNHSQFHPRIKAENTVPISQKELAIILNAFKKHFNPTYAFGDNPNLNLNYLYISINSGIRTETKAFIVKDKDDWFFLFIN
jgi:hypothetical protein